MKPTTYRTMRERLGTQPEAAKVLKVTERTLRRRENGQVKVGREAEWALRWALEKAGR